MFNRLLKPRSFQIFYIHICMYIYMCVCVCYLNSVVNVWFIFENFTEFKMNFWLFGWIFYRWHTSQLLLVQVIYAHRQWYALLVCVWSFYSTLEKWCRLTMFSFFQFSFPVSGCASSLQGLAPCLKKFAFHSNHRSSLPVLFFCTYLSSHNLHLLHSWVSCCCDCFPSICV